MKLSYFVKFIYMLYFFYFFLMSDGLVGNKMNSFMHFCLVVLCIPVSVQKIFLVLILLQFEEKATKTNNNNY